MGPENRLFEIQCLSSHPAISEKSIRFSTSFTSRKEELTVLSFFLLRAENRQYELGERRENSSFLLLAPVKGLLSLEEWVASLPSFMM